MCDRRTDRWTYGREGNVSSLLGRGEHISVVIPNRDGDGTNRDGYEMMCPGRVSITFLLAKSNGLRNDQSKRAFTVICYICLRLNCTKDLTLQKSTQAQVTHALIPNRPLWSVSGQLTLRIVYRVAVIFLSVCFSESYKGFQNRIPNGQNVPHPCKPNYLWPGVGHLNRNGGGIRNQFGLDFYEANMQWTTTLCQKDSDGDGRTNGEELGDPNCVWTEGAAPELTIGLSHPGICEPFNSATCSGKNDDIDCSTPGLNCPSLDRENSNDLLNVTLRFPETPVPAVETTYLCMTFDLPNDTDYHLIATQPIINNEYVMHHILLYGCDDNVRPQTVPGECNMGSCNIIIGGWTVGSYGDCSHEDAGFLVGRSGFKRVMMQFHWNNPMQVTNYKDSSGMLLHLTRNMRMNNAGVLMVGQSYLLLPPGEERINVEGDCTAQMSRAFLKGPIRFVSAVNHMHYLGRYMRMEHYRANIKLRDFTYEENFSYDSPKGFEYPNSIEFLPGDEIRLTCGFQTKDRSKTVFSGEGTSDEMCYGFLTFYPLENINYPHCVKWKSFDIVSLYTETEIDNCGFKDFVNVTHPTTAELHRRVMTHCGYLGQCREECISIIKEVKQNPCMQGDINFFLREQARMRPELAQIALFFSAIDSCNTEITQRSCPRA
ncbi:hypothetical protein FSP39_000478 [Pinctada imbricata]|uniref:Temptin n=1 Tax=Pinctada imbricata TaxID=66713 RepID=A0AA88XN57_PINIB|nr:hypothetical protein FSP39_000478 [Pinctada imbricata]